MSDRRSGKREPGHEILVDFSDLVRVQITPYGEMMWMQYHRHLMPHLSEAEIAERYPIERDENGYTEMPLYQVAHLFGPALYHGTPRLPIETTFKVVEQES